MWRLGGLGTMSITVLGWRTITGAIICVPALWKETLTFIYNNIYRWVNLEPSCWHGLMICFSWTIQRSSKLDQVRDGGVGERKGRMENDGQSAKVSSELSSALHRERERCQQDTRHADSLSWDFERHSQHEAFKVHQTLINHYCDFQVLCTARSWTPSLVFHMSFWIAPFPRDYS